MPVSNPRVFISYRRDDSAGWSGRVYDYLSRRYGAGNVFFDVGTVRPGADFVADIDRFVSSCDALVAVIGPGWLVASGEYGARLQQHDDHVRAEIASALASGVLVVPVLVDGAVMPHAADLPEPLAPLARRNAIEISAARFEYDAKRLAQTVDEQGRHGASIAQPETRFANSNGVHVAYQITGDENPVDLVFAPGSISHLDLDWEWDHEVAWYAQVSQFCRLIRFDKRGTGLSDRVTGAATLEERIDDIRAVMDAAGSRTAVIAGYSEGGSMAMLFAATYPERTLGLILSGTQARWTRTPDFPYPAVTEAEYASMVERLARDGPNEVWLYGPYCGFSRGDAAETQRTYRYCTACASPAALAALERMNLMIDTRDIVGLIRVPTLVVNALDDVVSPVAGAQWLADQIPGARLLTFESEWHRSMPDDPTAMAEIEQFVTRIRPAPRADSFLATVLSLQVDGADTDRTDRALHTEHFRLGGQIWRTGETTYIGTFDGPERAVRCAAAIRTTLSALGVHVRCGLHAGPIEHGHGNVKGLAVDVSVEVRDVAANGQVLVTRTVRDLTAGSTLAFAEAGRYRPRGIDDDWQLYALVALETEE
jgi:pimeloyl-ACP methyl ester carboxylesterase